MRACTRRSPARRSVWNAIWPWRASCSRGCCRNPAEAGQPGHRRKIRAGRAIGGDFTILSIIRFRGPLLVIGDVSGKGAPAAIYAALVSGIFRSHAPIEPGPAEMLRAVNFSLGERRIDAQFVSLIYAVWDDLSDPASANSGFPALSTATMARPNHRGYGLAAGIVRRCGLRRILLLGQARRSVRLLQRWHPGRPQPAGEIFGRNRVEQSSPSVAQGGGCVVDSLFNAVAEYAADFETFDDQTVVAIKVKETAGKKKK